jgi:peptidoglycan/LPS O-acetylase OafA/YrhL
MLGLLEYFVPRFIKDTLQPKYSKLSFLRSTILDFSLDIVNPRSRRKLYIFGANSFRILSSEGLVIIMSSTYLIDQHLAKFLCAWVPCLGLPGLIISSKPFKVKLHSVGDITPPWGVPLVGNVITPFSTTPAFNHFDINIRPVLNNNSSILFSINS